MNHIKLSGVILLLVLLCACTSTHQKTLTAESDFSGQLTQAEISNGVLTPEILWKFGRLVKYNYHPMALK